MGEALTGLWHWSVISCWPRIFFSTVSRVVSPLRGSSTSSDLPMWRSDRETNLGKRDIDLWVSVIFRTSIAGYKSSPYDSRLESFLSASDGGLIWRSEKDTKEFQVHQSSWHLRPSLQTIATLILFLCGLLLVHSIAVSSTVLVGKWSNPGVGWKISWSFWCSSPWSDALMSTVRVIHHRLENNDGVLHSIKIPCMIPNGNVGAY